MEKDIVHTLAEDKVERLKKTASYASDDSTQQLVIGSSNLYDENGELRLIPAPTADPKGT